MSEVARFPQADIGLLHGERDIERLALAAADVLQQLVVERQELRRLNGIQERELLSLRSANEDLRRRITVIRESYLKLGTEFSRQLQHIDEAIRKAEPAI
jgi:prephenate dehydrogenase